MSPKLPRITASDVLRALLRDGWFKARQSGSHVILRHPTKPGRVTVPVHQGEIIAPKTLAHILKDASLSVEEFIALL